MRYRIKENSWQASFGKRYMKCKAIAMVIGNTIHLSGISREEFMKDENWLKHELVHINQYHKYGTLKFLFIYLRESIRKGYYNNKFEVEAREKKDEIVLDNFQLQLSEHKNE